VFPENKEKGAKVQKIVGDAIGPTGFGEKNSNYLPNRILRRSASAPTQEKVEPTMNRESFVSPTPRIW